MKTIQRIEDLQLIVAQTLERLQALQRYVPHSIFDSPVMYHDSNGDWIDVSEMLQAIIDLRRAMGDSVFSEEVLK